MGMEWKQFQGQTVNDNYELSALLGESSPGEVPETAVFLTYLDSTHTHKAAIKLFPLEELSIKDVLVSWGVAQGTGSSSSPPIAGFWGVDLSRESVRIRGDGIHRGESFHDSSVEGVNG